jgi:hypothetical protein
MKKSVFVLFMLISTVYSQSKITGIITENIDGANEPVPFVNLLVKETNKGGSTDFDGNYTISLAPGNYTLEVSFVGYKTQIIAVNVLANENKEVNISLIGNSELIDEFVVVGKANRESKSMDILTTKQAVGLENNLGAQKIAEVGASNASDATKKIVGLSVVGSGYVFVRGMGDRYNSAYLNGLPVASPDPDKKVIPLNIFPASVIQSLSVKKSFTANLEGDFSGGAIDIKTKDYPEEPTLKVSLGTGFNSQTTFKDVLTYKGGKTDYLGFDDGTRAIPDAIKEKESYLSTEGDKSLFASNLNSARVKAKPNSSFSLYTGNLFTLKNDSRIGYLVSINHGNSSAYEYGKYKLINKQVETKIDYDIEKYTVSTNSSVLTNVGYEINKNHKINYNFLFVNLSSNETRETFGTHFDYGSKVYSRRYTYRQNSLMVNQLSGNHNLLNDKLKFNWASSFNNAASKEPDRRQMVYLYDDKENTTSYVINARDRIDNHRFFSELQEQQFNAKAEAKYVFKYSGENIEDAEKLSATFGAFIKRKNRNFDYSQYVYDLGGVNNNNPNGVDVYNPDTYINASTHETGDYVISEALNPASAYEANQSVTAYYTSVNYLVTSKLGLIGGLRFEDGLQTILYRDQTQPGFMRKNIVSSYDFLPSLIAKYQLNEKNIVRGSFSKTISRPGFKEVAPFEYIELFAGAKTIGNPTLINGENYNYDLRYEFYPKYGEFFAIGVFYKNLINPIEKTMEVTASGQLQSFKNADEATLNGIEVEMTKSLDFMTKDTSIFTNLFLGVNVAYLNSQVNFKDGNFAQTNSKRALQGASPYIVNVDLTYAKRLNEKVKTTYTLSYNVFGKRIFNVGTFGLGDIYEMPVNTLNFIANAEIGKFNIGVKVKNILNPLISYEQVTDNAPVIVNSSKVGRFASITIGYTF